MLYRVGKSPKPVTAADAAADAADAEHHLSGTIIAAD